MSNTSSSLPEIPLAIVGCDFRTASSQWRSRLVLDDGEALAVAADLEKGGWAQGMVDLNTCNRNEWMVCATDPRWAAELLRGKMLERLGLSSGIEPYMLVGEEAARHVFRVAIGQESLVVGERQVAGQLFKALEMARARDTSCRILNGVGSIAGRLVRIAIRRGCMGSNASGVHSLALAYVRSRIQGADRSEVTVIGLGSIGRRVLGLLEQDPGVVPRACNRTVSDDSAIRVHPLAELPSLLASSDAAIVATGARQPVIGPKLLPERSPNRPLLIVDIGIPEQVVRHGLPEGIEVVGLDELTAFHEPGHKSVADTGDCDSADELVERALDELRRFCNEPTFAEVLDAVQQRHRRVATDVIPSMVAGKFGHLSDEDRAQLQAELRSVLLAYDSEVFKAIRAASKNLRETEA